MLTRQPSGSLFPDWGSSVRARRCVLIVDDDQDTREMYAWCMRAAGWLVSEVEDGKAAVAVAGALHPHVIVMDLCLPVLGGLQATVHLKMNERTRHIPIVACTGFDPLSSEGLAKKVGCEEFVAKPCLPEDLRDLLEDLLVRRRVAG
ncbi:MAG: response regulator [Polyangiaceae bacterium]